MLRQLVMFLMVACGILVTQMSATAQQPGPGNQLPTFAAQVAVPVANGANRWDVTLGGSFTNLSATLKVAFSARSFNTVTSQVVNTYSALTIVEGPAGMGEQTGIVRPAAAMQNGTFTGFVSLSDYTPGPNLRYQMRIEFYSNNGALINVYKDANKNEWIAIPTK